MTGSDVANTAPQTLARSHGVITTRQASIDDEEVLAAIDLATWDQHTSPVPPPEARAYRFFGERTLPRDVFVAVRKGAVCGYVKLWSATDLPSRAHIVEIKGLAVDPRQQRTGAGSLLLETAVAEARQRGARKVTLRVLGHNRTARSMYERSGFVVEAVLRDEFRIEGRYVDDVMMARHLAVAEGPQEVSQ